MNPQNFDTEYSIWQERTVVRCKVCWRSMIRDGVADNNGWFPFDTYPHAEWCRENRQSTRK
jgi:hypothetical protein